MRLRNCWYDVASCESVRYFLPGTLIRTTFFPAQFLLASYSCGRPQLAGSESVIGTQLQFDVSKRSHRIMDSIEAPKAGYVTKDLLKLDALWEFVANLQWCHYVLKTSRSTEYFRLSLSIIVRGEGGVLPFCGENRASRSSSEGRIGDA